MTKNRPIASSTARDLGISGIVFTLLTIAAVIALLLVNGSTWEYNMTFIISIMVLGALYLFTSVLLIATAYKDDTCISISGAVLCGVSAIAAAVHFIWIAIRTRNFTKDMDLSGDLSKEQTGTIAGYAILIITGIALMVIFVYGTIKCVMLTLTSIKNKQNPEDPKQREKSPRRGGRNPDPEARHRTRPRADRRRHGRDRADERRRHDRDGSRSEERRKNFRDEMRSVPDERRSARRGRRQSPGRMRPSRREWASRKVPEVRGHGRRGVQHTQKREHRAMPPRGAYRF